MRHRQGHGTQPATADRIDCFSAARSFAYTRQNKVLLEVNEAPGKLRQRRDRRCLFGVKAKAVVKRRHSFLFRPGPPFSLFFLSRTPTWQCFRVFHLVSPQRLSRRFLWGIRWVGFRIQICVGRFVWETVIAFLDVCWCVWGGGFVLGGGTRTSDYPQKTTTPPHRFLILSAWTHEFFVSIKGVRFLRHQVPLHAEDADQVHHLDLRHHRVRGLRGIGAVLVGGGRAEGGSLHHLQGRTGGGEGGLGGSGVVFGCFDPQGFRRLWGVRGVSFLGLRDLM